MGTKIVRVFGFMPLTSAPRQDSNLRTRLRRGLRYMPLACGNVLAGVWPGRVSGAAHLAKGAGHA
jgi:hypothetical protein